MMRAIEGVATGEVTIASRDVTLDGIDVRKGAWLGLADGAPVASGAELRRRSPEPWPSGCSTAAGRS